MHTISSNGASVRNQIIIYSSDVETESERAVLASQKIELPEMINLAYIVVYEVDDQFIIAVMFVPSVIE